MTSLGSSQILFLPQPTTEAASRFWVVRLTLVGTLLARPLSCLLLGSCGGG